MAQIKDPLTGDAGRVTPQGQFRTVSESQSLQHYISWNEENTYQVISVDTGITAKTQTQMHIINNDPDRSLVISYIRFQGTNLSATLPGTGDYISIGTGRTISSGGTAATPVNMNFSSGKTASVTCTGIDPTMTGTFTEFDRWYVKSDGEEIAFRKEGSIILGLNDTFELRFTSSGTGEAETRVTFMMLENGR